MFDIEDFAKEICRLAYPGYNEQEDWKVYDVLRYNTDEKPPTVRDFKDSEFVSCQWAQTGIDADVLNTRGSSAISFELRVSAKQVRLLNAFHWAANETLNNHNDVHFSDLLGDVEEDEVVKGDRKASGRALRVWGFTVDGAIKGMEPV